MVLGEITYLSDWEDLAACCQCRYKSTPHVSPFPRCCLQKFLSSVVTFSLALHRTAQTLSSRISRLNLAFLSTLSLTNCCVAKCRSTSSIPVLLLAAAGDGSLWPWEFLLQPRDSWEEWCSPARWREAEKGRTTTRFSCRNMRRFPRKRRKSLNRYKLRTSARAVLLLPYPWWHACSSAEM